MLDKSYQSGVCKIVAVVKQSKQLVVFHKVAKFFWPKIKGEFIMQGYNTFTVFTAIARGALSMHIHYVINAGTPVDIP